MEATSSMQTTTGGIAVVTTTLAQTDRRALSQAWYSALHLAENAASRGGKRAIHGQAAVRSALRTGERAGSERPRVPVNATRVVARLAGPRPPGLPPERRVPAGGLTRRIAKLIARPAAAPQPIRAATVTVRGARVHVIVRTQGAATRVVALCPPPLEARVARALAHARFALAARGVRAEAGA